MHRTVFLTTVAALFLAFATDRVFSAPIHEAIAAGDIVKVETLLKADPKLANYREGIVDPPMVTAATAGNPKILELLIAAGGDVNAGDLRGHQPLYWSIALDKAEAVAVLLKHGADVNAGPEPVLFLAAGKGNHELIALLRRSGAKTNAVSRDGRTLLHAAVEGGGLALVKELVEAGMEVNAGNVVGATPLFAAAGGGHLEVAKYLLAKGAKPNIISKDDNTPMSAAASSDEQWAVPMVELLLAHRADPNLGVNTNTYTPTIWFASRGNVEGIKHMLEAGADINGKGTNERWTPLIAAARLGRTDAVRFLLEKGADVTATDYKGRTALHHAMNYAEKHPEANPALDALKTHMAKAGVSIDAATKPAVDKEWAEISRLVAAKLPPPRREPPAIPADNASQEKFVSLTLRLLTQVDGPDTSLRQHMLVKTRNDQEVVNAVEALLAASAALNDQVRITFPEQADTQAAKGLKASSVNAAILNVYQDAVLKIEGDTASLTPKRLDPVAVTGGEKPKAIYFARSGQEWKIDISRMWETGSMNIDQFSARNRNVVRAYMATIRDLRLGRIKSPNEIQQQIEINTFAAEMENPAPKSQPDARRRSSTQQPMQQDAPVSRPKTK